MKRILTALTLAISTALAAPAMAGGTISFSINASNAEEANAIRAGLTLYQIVNDIDTNGHISQNGVNNIAALAQGGSGNIGIIHQEGNNHDATLIQQNGNNSCGVFQFGNSATANVQQSGGEACLVLQAGF